MYKKSEIKKISKYWIKQSEILEWKKKPSTAVVFKKESVNWYPDGKASVFYNCIIKNIKLGLGNKTAIYYLNEKEAIREISYKNLLFKVNKFSNFVKSKYLKKNNKNIKIMIHASAGLDTAIAMLACTKLGIHFCVVFKELKIEAIKKRIDLFRPDIFLTEINPEYFNKDFSKAKYKNILIYKINEYKKFKGSYSYNYKNFNGDRDFFTLFTSGSTGIPKGIVHSTCGYLTYIAIGCKKKFGINKNSIILCASDAGWINGHTYSLFGPLFFGASTLILKSPFLLTNKKILKKVINLGITILYLPVTLIRIMRQIYNNEKFQNQNLITLGSMGEPLAPEVGKWFVETFGKKNQAIVNTYFQTETGGIISSHSYNQKINNKFYGSVGYPFSKFVKFEKILNKQKKELKLSYPWPGQMKRILNGYDQWIKYFDKKNQFKLFDLATINQKNIFVHGRTDDVINIRGHRIGSEEIESTLLQLKNVIEVAAISIENEIEGNVFYIFIACKKNSKYLEKAVNNKIHKNFGSFAIPKNIYLVNELPKTRSGKILRRVLRNLLKNNKITQYDTSTLLKKSVVGDIEKIIKQNLIY